MFNLFRHDDDPEQPKPRKSPAKCVRESKEMREHLTEDEIDKTLKDTFPASDPPAWY